MKIAIVDDDLQARRDLQQILQGCEIKPVAESEMQLFASGESFLVVFKPKEFQIVFLDICMDGVNGIETARAMLEKAFGTEKAKEILGNAAATAPIKPFEFLSEADSEKVSLVLHDESNAVRALVLSYLKPKIAAEVIRSFPPLEKKDVVLRLASLKKIDPEVLRRQVVLRMAPSSRYSIPGRNSSTMATEIRAPRPRMWPI